MSQAEITAAFITKMNDDLMNPLFTKRSDEKRHNGEDLQACERQEMKAFTPKHCQILTQTTRIHSQIDLSHPVCLFLLFSLILINIHRREGSFL